MMRLPSERELELYHRIKPWFDFLGKMPALKANAPENIRKDFEEWLELSAGTGKHKKRLRRMAGTIS